MWRVYKELFHRPYCIISRSERQEFFSKSLNGVTRQGRERRKCVKHALFLARPLRKMIRSTTQRMEYWRDSQPSCLVKGDGIAAPAATGL